MLPKTAASADAVTRVPLSQKFVVLAIVWAAFGPYLYGGIRTEQLAVYGFLVLLIVLPFLSVKLRVMGGMKLLVPMICVLVIASLDVMFPTPFDAAWDSGQTLAGFDNLFLPIAVMLVIWALVNRKHAAELLISAGKVVVWMAALNGILAIIAVRMDLSPYLEVFWTSAAEDGSTSTAFKASTLGRFSGLFNQPAEAGVMYGLAALLAVYIYKHKGGRLFLALTLIVIGGLISVSKVFILGGIPLLVIYLWRSRTIGGKVGFLATAAIITAGVSQTGWLQSWTGFSYLTRLLAPAEGQGLVEFYTAGRWNEGSTLNSVIDEVMRVSPLWGVGAGGWKVPYDSGWTEILVMAGILGAIFHGIVLMGLLWLAKGTLDPARKQLTYFTAFFLIGADLGIPSLTANRVATVAWVILALLVLAAASDSAAAEPAAVKANEAGES